MIVFTGSLRFVAKPKIDLDIKNKKGANLTYIKIEHF